MTNATTSKQHTSDHSPHDAPDGTDTGRPLDHATPTADSTQLGASAARDDWTGIVEIPVDIDSGYRIHPALQDRLTAALAGRAPIVSQGPTSVRVLFGVEATTVRAAQADASKVADFLLPALGLQNRTPCRVEVRTPEALEDPAPVLVGLNEAASLLGVSRQRATQIASQATFPKPIQRLRATPVWLESEVRRFAQKRRLHVHAR